MGDTQAITEVLARYVRATDERDGAGQGALFTDDAVTQIYARTDDGYEAAGEPLIGGSGVRFAVENFLAAHPSGGCSHHITADHLVEIDGDSAHLNAQYLVLEVRSLPEPAIRIAETGYYDTDLRRVNGEWKIVHHRVLGDLPLGVQA
jgi:hypothetical protein